MGTHAGGGGIGKKELQASIKAPSHSATFTARKGRGKKKLEGFDPETKGFPHQSGVRAEWIGERRLNSLSSETN